jgi:hypothetical protein
MLDRYGIRRTISEIGENLRHRNQPLEHISTKEIAAYPLLCSVRRRREREGGIFDVTPFA